MEIKINYSDNNGRFVIGEKEYKFTTMWTKASNTSIYFYNDPEDIEDIALAKNIFKRENLIKKETEIKKVIDILNLTDLNFSSRHRMAELGDVAIFRNINKKYLFCIPKIIKVNNGSNTEETLEMHCYIKDISSSKLFLMVLKKWLKKNWLTVILNGIGRIFGIGRIGDIIENWIRIK